MTTERRSPDAAYRHGRLSFFKKRWFVRREEDERPWFEASFVFQARDMAQAEFLFLEMEDGLKCPNGDPDHVCPHFRVGGLHQIDADD